MRDRGIEHEAFRDDALEHFEDDLFGASMRWILAAAVVVGAVLGIAAAMVWS